MIQFLQSLYLAVQHLFFRLTLDSSDVDDFDCYFLLGFVVGASVDDGTETSADDVFEAVGVVLYLFSKIVVGVERVVHLNIK
jgi:hypothetical protein